MKGDVKSEECEEAEEVKSTREETQIGVQVRKVPAPAPAWAW